MRIQKHNLLVWIIAAFSVVLLLFSSLADGLQIDQDLLDLVFLVYLAMGGLVAIRYPKNAIGWILLGGVFIHSTNSVFGWYANLGLQVQPGSLPAADVVAALMNGLGNFGFGLLLAFPLLLFPNGRLLSRRWLPILWLIVLWMVLVMLTTFRPGPLVYFPSWNNPLGSDLLAGYFETSQTAVFEYFTTVLFIACPLSLILRYRRAAKTERQQIKWVAYAAGFMGLVTGLMLVIGPFIQLAEIWYNLIFLVLVVSIPVSIGIAILRYRLYDIDIIIRRTLQYALLTGLLALFYFGSVILLQSLFETLTGQRSPIVIVISTLAIAALFNPLRRRVQEFIDRRFYRRKYDAQQALATFAATARDEVELEQITEQLLSVVQETMQPEGVSLWLRPSESSSFVVKRIEGKGWR